MIKKTCWHREKITFNFFSCQTTVTFWWWQKMCLILITFQLSFSASIFSLFVFFIFNNHLQKKFQLSFLHIYLQSLVLQQDLSLQLVWWRHRHSFLHRVRRQKVLQQDQWVDCRNKEACGFQNWQWEEVHLQQHVSKNLFKVGCHLQLLHPASQPY